MPNSYDWVTCWLAFLFDRRNGDRNKIYGNYRYCSFQLVPMPRKPDEYAVHLLISGGHREEVRFKSVQEFQKWYSSELMAKSDSEDFVNVPIKNIQGEYMVIRPKNVLAIRVEPIFLGSVERF